MSSPRRYIPKPMTALPSVPDVSMDADVSGQSFSYDVEALLEQAGLALSREIRNLVMKSASGKLQPPDARDLVAYIKLLHEIKSEQQEVAAALTDKELEELVKG